MQLSQRRKPLQRRSEATVECVLDAAALVLEHSGLAGYNTNAIANRAGIGIGSVYQYFPRKEAITAALILRAHQQIADGLTAMIAQTRGCDLDTAMAMLIENIVRSQAVAPKLTRILEMEEIRLARSDELCEKESEIEQLNRAFFSRYIAIQHRNDRTLDTISRDIICIVRSLLDSAARSGALDAPELPERIARTIRGYLAPLLVEPKSVWI